MYSLKRFNPHPLRHLHVGSSYAPVKAKRALFLSFNLRLNKLKRGGEKIPKHTEKKAARGPKQEQMTERKKNVFSRTLTPKKTKNRSSKMYIPKKSVNIQKIRWGKKKCSPLRGVYFQ